MGKGGKGKSKKSVDWYEIKLIVQLPPEDRLHESGTGMSKQNIYDFFLDLDKRHDMIELDESEDYEEVSRNVSKKIVDQILERGEKSHRIKHRPRYTDETARFGYYYRTPTGDKWISLKREFRSREKALSKK